MSIFSFRRKGKRPRRGESDALNDVPVQRPQTFSPPAHGNSSTFLNRRDSKRRKHVSVQAGIGNGASAPAATLGRFPGPALTTQSHVDLNNQVLRQPASVDTFPPHGRLVHNRSEASIDESRFPAPSLIVRKNKGRGLLRRKSTRRKQSDRAREQQIREMSSRNDSSAGLPNRLSVDAPHSTRAFRVGAFDAWTPRPRLKCTETSFQTPAASRNPSSSSTARDRIPAGPFVPTERIATLADAMDSRDLRQLLERDQRRSLRDRGAEAFINRRLQQENTRPEPEADAGQPMATSNNNSGSWLEDPSKENLAPKGLSSADAQMVMPQPPEQQPVDTRTPISNTSNMPLTPVMSTSDLSRSLHNEKRDSSTHLARSLAGIFRRASSRLKKRPEPTQSSFSITSRDSLAKPPVAQPAQARDIPTKPVLRHAAASNHSGSRFTEHLNDFSDSTPVPGPLGMVDDPYAPSQRVSTIDRYSVSFVSTSDIRDERGTRANSADGNGDALMMAQSLASIDSEGSWLSGKPSRRLSQQHRNNLRKSASSTKERLDESAESVEHDDSAEDNIFGQFSILEEESEQTGGSGSSELSPHNARPDSGSIKPESEKFHASVGKRPVVVSPKARAKSTEGLFTAYQESVVEPSTPEPPETPTEDAHVQRATSIDLGKGHVRHISAGSARLLDLSSPRPVEKSPDSETSIPTTKPEEETANFVSKGED